mgnify:FL=1
MVKTDLLFKRKRWRALVFPLFFLTFYSQITHGQALACNDNVQVSLNGNCEADITPGMILEGEDETLLDNYVVTIEGVNGTLVTEIGVYNVTVTDITNGNSCWGTITVEDKLAPIVEDCQCPEGDPTPECEFVCTDLTNILNNTLPTLPQPIVNENCGTYTSAYSDLVSEGDCGQQIVTRSWVFTDNSGNVSTGCVQEFILNAVELDDVVQPTSPLELPCGQDVAMPAIVNYLTPIIGVDAANQAAYPTVNGVPLIGTVCNLIVTKTDLEIPVCDQSCSNSFKILRDWVVIDWCNSEVLEFTQIIKAVDTEAPTVVANDITVSTDAWSCESTFFLPAPEILHDACTDFVDYVVTGPAGVTIVWNAQNNLYLASGAPKGVHTFNYIASDCCDNTATDPIQVTVLDQTAPVAIAKQNIVISLTQSGTAKLFAPSVDNGSHDGCTNVKLEVRRDADQCNIIGNATYDNDGHPQDSPSDPDDGEFVKFCCEDITHAEADVDGDGILDPGYIMVWLRVWDDADMNGQFGTSGDNYNETWSYVKVEDKLNPVIACPPDVTITCLDDYTDTSITGEATAFGACGDVDVTYTDISVNLSSCNIGYVIRRWSVVGSRSVV